MRFSLIFALLAFAGCTGSDTVSRTQAITCDDGQTVVFSNRFAPAPGGSGVATGEDAANGAINSDGPTGGGVGISEGDTTLDGPSAPSTAPALPNPTTKPIDGPLTAMTESCQPSMCAPGQVAVEVPPTPGSVNGGPVGVGPDPTAGPIDDGGLGIESEPAPPAPSTPPVVLSPPGTLVCVDAPPSCPDGQSPQFTSKMVWECTDCALVVTYGGIYGNYRRCVNEPTIVCPDGETPTWVFETEQWECKTTCDNGQYDQHTVDGLLLCVPC
jgi:hypothetical protein